MTVYLYIYIIYTYIIDYDSIYMYIPYRSYILYGTMVPLVLENDVKRPAILRRFNWKLEMTNFYHASHRLSHIYIIHIYSCDP